MKNKKVVKNFNVLVTSISKKVPLLEKVKKALDLWGAKNSLFGADAEEKVIGAYFVDQFWKMPPLNQLTKRDLLDYCKEHQINAIIPTRDGELLFFAKIQEYLLAHGIAVMVSSEESLKKCLDKELFYQFLFENGFETPETHSDISQIKAKFFVVKEKRGSGSKGLFLKLTKKEAIESAKLLKEPIFQPFIEGIEYTVDLYIEKKEAVKGVIARKRELVVDGESQISTTVKLKELEDLCSKAALKLNLRGHVLFQVIQYEDTKSKKIKYSIIECNPRFGGASTLSVEAGLESFLWFFDQTLNRDLTAFKRSLKEIKLVRHAKDSYFSL